MGYWKPSKTQARAFFEKMQDPTEAAEYEARKKSAADKRREGSNFDYNTAGGFYVPTQNQHDFARRLYFSGTLTSEQDNACNLVMSAFLTKEKVHHDSIHIVNQLIRANK